MGQPKVLQLRELDKVGQRTPPCLTSVMMERALVLEPVPQVLVHALYPDQLETLQSMGQAKVWQVLYSLSMGQLRPPLALVVRMERLRFLVPVAQVAEQALKAVQAVKRQSMGQAKVLQVLMDDLSALVQGFPPYASVVMIERLRFLVPEAQVAEQVENRLQLDNTQSMGQGWLLHVVLERNPGQPTPP